MKKTKHMLIGLIYVSIGTFLVFGDFSFTSFSLIQHWGVGVSHLAIWLGFLVAVSGIVLLVIGVQSITRAMKQQQSKTQE